jgi:hypothetical protein
MVPMSAYYPDEQDLAFMSAQAPYGNAYPQTHPYPPPVASNYSSIDVSQSMAPTTTLGYSDPSSYVAPDHSYGQMPLPTYAQQPLWTPATTAAEAAAELAYSAASFAPTSAPMVYPEVMRRSSPVPSYSSHASRSPSASSTAFGGINFATPEGSRPDLFRSSSPNNADLRQFGYINDQGTWSCSFPGCTSRAVFTRGCDLRKHHKRHTKSFFCHHEGCPQATGGGFSSKKDLARHEAKHNPGVMCEWEGCDRVFSRVDNMVRITPTARNHSKSLGAITNI